MGKCGRRLRYGGTVVHAVKHRIHAGQIKGTVVYARVGRDLQNAAPVERRGLDRHKGHRCVVEPIVAVRLGGGPGRMQSVVGNLHTVFGAA